MLITFDKKKPQVAQNTFIAPNASIIGDVEIGPESSVWFGAVVRGDFSKITIGKRSNIQDLSLIHVTEGMPVVVGDDVTVGHRAILHSCKIGNRILIGMGAILMDGVVVEENSIVAAGSLLIEGTIVPAGKLILGRPGKVVRDLKEDELKWLTDSSLHYAECAKEYQKTYVKKF